MPTADSLFVIGASHTICQDYARTEVVSERAFAALADGCSSSPDTDIGARYRVLDEMFWLKVDPSLASARVARPPVPLPPGWLDTTCLTIQSGPGLLRIKVSGDGYIIAKKVTGQTFIWRISFLGPDGSPSGYPIYPSYKEDRLTEALKLSPTRKIELWGEGPTASESRQNIRELPNAEWNLDPLEYSLVAIASDGFDSFYRVKTSDTWKGTWKRNESLDPLGVIREMFAFKGMQGTFLQRRVRSVLRRYAAEGIFHSDDLSIAAIYLGDHNEDLGEPETSDPK